MIDLFLFIRIVYVYRKINNPCCIVLFFAYKHLMWLFAKFCFLNSTHGEMVLFVTVPFLFLLSQFLPSLISTAWIAQMNKIFKCLLQVHYINSKCCCPLTIIEFNIDYLAKCQYILWRYFIIRLWKHKPIPPSDISSCRKLINANFYGKK